MQWTVIVSLCKILLGVSSLVHTRFPLYAIHALCMSILQGAVNHEENKELLHSCIVYTYQITYQSIYLLLSLCLSPLNIYVIKVIAQFYSTKKLSYGIEIKLWVKVIELD